jgi:hypothetical protein
VLPVVLQLAADALRVLCHVDKAGNLLQQQSSPQGRAEFSPAEGGSAKPATKPQARQADGLG